jgi:hypothetical protein
MAVSLLVLMHVMLSTGVSSLLIVLAIDTRLFKEEDFRDSYFYG